MAAGGRPSRPDPASPTSDMMFPGVDLAVSGGGRWWARAAAPPCRGAPWRVPAAAAYLSVSRVGGGPPGGHPPALRGTAPAASSSSCSSSAASRWCSAHVCGSWASASSVPPRGRPQARVRRTYGAGGPLRRLPGRGAGRALTRLPRWPLTRHGGRRSALRPGAVRGLPLDACRRGVGARSRQRYCSPRRRRRGRGCGMEVVPR